MSLTSLSEITKIVVIYPGIPYITAISAVAKFWDDRHTYNKGFGIRECIIYDYGDVILIVYETKTSIVVRKPDDTAEPA